jgi:negative regulator of sigma E activity
MPRVVITQYTYAHTNEDALEIARKARLDGKRSEIITDEKYTSLIAGHFQMQDLRKWAEFNKVPYKPSI